MNITKVSALLFINCVGPSLTEFRPEKYVRSWLVKGRHSADDTASRKREKKATKSTKPYGNYYEVFIV